MNSQFAVCCYIPCFALRCEAERAGERSAYPLALLNPNDSRRVWQVSPEARRTGVKPGITVSQAIGLSPTLRIYEPDPIYYDAQFTALLDALSTVSPVIEPAELGRVYVGTDGMEGIFGSVERVLENLLTRIEELGTRNGNASFGSAFRLPPSAFRFGWGRGKFVSWVAASRAPAGTVVIVPPGEEPRFLSRQPLSVLPLDADTHTRLRQLGLRTLADVTALPEDALAAQFGSAGRRLWRLAAGRGTEPIEGRVRPEPITAALTFFAPIAEQQLLLRSLEQLIDRALAHPRRAGWRVQGMRVQAEVENGGSWMMEVLLKEPAAERRQLLAPLKVRLEHAPPAKAVERLTLEFTSFVPGTVELQLFARDAGAAARAGRRRALRNASREIALRLDRPMLYHVVPVHPSSRIPERRYGLMDYEP